jgi:hypothetical protein
MFFRNSQLIAVKLSETWKYKPSANLFSPGSLRVMFKSLLCTDERIHQAKP